MAQDVYLKDLWPSAERSRHGRRGRAERPVHRRVRRVFDGDERWNRSRCPKAAASCGKRRRPTCVGRRSSRVARARTDRRHRGRPRARAARRHGHHRPHFPRRVRSRRTRPRRVPQERGRARDFNSYGSRRGNHEVMMRGTFANVRLRNYIASQELERRHHAPRRRADVDLRRVDPVPRGGHAALGDRR